MAFNLPPLLIYPGGKSHDAANVASNAVVMHSLACAFEVLSHSFRHTAAIRSWLFACILKSINIFALLAVLISDNNALILRNHSDNTTEAMRKPMCKSLLHRYKCHQNYNDSIPMHANAQQKPITCRESTAKTLPQICRSSYFWTFQNIFRSATTLHSRATPLRQVQKALRMGLLPDM